MALSPDERLSAERAITGALRHIRIFRRGARVAVYLAMPGEVSLALASEAALQSGCKLYVPSVTSRRRSSMAFVPMLPGTPMRKNVYGISEPVMPDLRRLRPLDLDVVLMPVVGFDRSGNRLGMGAGYYDRALKHLRDGARRWRRPRLIGLAFSCQEVERIEPSRWDVPLDVVVTERETILTGRARTFLPRRSNA